MIRIDLNVFKETWNNQSSKNSFENNRSGGGKGSRRTTRGEIHPRRYVPTGTKKERKKESGGCCFLKVGKPILPAYLALARSIFTNIRFTKIKYRF